MGKVFSRSAAAWGESVPGGVFVRNSGSWEEIKSLYVRDGGSWFPVFRYLTGFLRPDQKRSFRPG